MLYKSCDNCKKDYEFLINNINEVIFRIDSKGYFKYLNKSWTDVTGFNSEESIEKPFIEFIHPSDREKKLKNFSLALRRKDESHKAHFRHLTKSNKYIWVEVLSKIILNKEGNLDYIIGTITEKDENDILGYSDDINEFKKAKNQIIYMSYYDKLTGLPNRDYLTEYFDKNYSDIDKHGDQLALLFLNIDRFKNINDSLGYKVGDQLLKLIAERFKNYLCHKKAIIIRMSGDKFIVTTEYEDREEIDTLVKGLFKALREPFKVSTHELFITTSIGISIYSSCCDNLDNLMKYAETAMHRTKDEGKNGYQYFREFMNLENVRGLTIETQLRKALERNEFYLVYQPKVNSIDGIIGGVEALIRWDSPELGLISPVEFIGIAEETGLIVPIGAWVLEESCKQTKIWNDGGFDIVVSVNISAVQLQRYNFVDTVKDIIKRTGVNPEFLDLEITENGIMKNVAESEQIMRELSSMGIKISIDDFGTGFSSLSYIKRFQSNTLKIDRSFVKDIPNDENDMSITLAVINMARSLNMSTVAEGVENIEQLDFLRANKCDVIQGFYFSKPVRPEEMNNLLEGNKTHLYRNI